MINWDDLRIVLAVARSGSALRAARELKINQTTVLRRIARIEEATGFSLFESRQSGQCLTPIGQQVVAAAEIMEREASALQSAISAHQRVLSGSVRFTSSESFANRIVAPCLGDFRAKQPCITVELIADDRRLDLSRNEADVALRADAHPEGAGIVAQRMPDIVWAVYCGRNYAMQHGTPASADELDKHAIVRLEGTMSGLPASRWLTSAAPNATVSTRSNSLSNLASALKAGLGVGVLPCFVGDSEPDLVRCFTPVRELDSELWLIVREEIKTAPHVRAFVDFLAARLHQLRPQLGGMTVTVAAEPEVAR